MHSIWLTITIFVSDILRLYYQMLASIRFPLLENRYHFTLTHDHIRIAKPLKVLFEQIFENNSTDVQQLSNETFMLRKTANIYRLNVWLIVNIISYIITNSYLMIITISESLVTQTHSNLKALQLEKWSIELLQYKQRVNLQSNSEIAQLVKVVLISERTSFDSERHFAMR